MGAAPRAPEPLAPSLGLRRGLHAGEVSVDPVPTGPRGGRVRRWTYVAAGDADTIVGAAVVHLGVVGTVFAFARVAGRDVNWEVKRPLGRGLSVGSIPALGAVADVGQARVRLGGDGAIELDVPTASGRLRAEVRAGGAVTPATLATRTSAGGWNVTQKTAGTPVTGEVRLGEAPAVALAGDAGGWSDWTVGRQDRHTRWRWAAGAGVATDGRRVAINASTGMNGEEAGEDVVWWDGVPHRMPVTDLRPAGPDPTGAWLLGGPGAELHLEPTGVRSADERLVIATSSYVQPYGRWSGSLTGPDGQARTVALAGVAEDHLAIW